jgi:hypothetical protein
MNVGFPPDAPWSVFLAIAVAWIIADTGRFIDYRLLSDIKFEFWVVSTARTCAISTLNNNHQITF